MLGNTHSSVNLSLKILWDIVSHLPETVPNASDEDCIYWSFHDDPACTNKSAFAAFKQAYSHSFKPNCQGLGLVNNVLQGERGMDLVVSNLETIAKLAIMSSKELKLTNFLICELLELVHEQYVTGLSIPIV